MPSKHTFFVPPSAIASDVAVLPDSEAQHATRALRLGVGDTIQIVDGEGGRMQATLELVSRKGVTARIQVREQEAHPNAGSITLYAALLKNSGRYETVIEKAAELGVARLVPMSTSRSERARFRTPRAEAILAAAMKQSGSAWHVDLAPVTGFPEMLKAHSDSNSIRVLCHESAAPSDTLLRILADNEGATGADPQGYVLAIGPEGGFTDQEVEDAHAAGFRVASLGPTRLRAETASIAALATLTQSLASR